MSENPVDDYLASFAGEPARYPLNKQRTWELQPHEDYADQLVIVRNKRVIAVIDRDNFDDADHIVLCVNAHAALVEACEAASEALYAATACGAQSRHEQEQVNEARVKIESALSKARPKGKE